MKRNIFLASLLAAGVTLAGEPPRAAASASGARAPAATSPSETNVVALSVPQRAGLNFHDDSLDLVLDYLSESLGFIINKEAAGPSTVDLGGQAPAGREQALASLTAALKKSGHALLRQGRILTLTSLERVNGSDLDVRVGADPAAVEKSADVITQIIPVRYAGASQLAANLRVVLPASVSLSVNETANTLLLVASKTDIRRALTIVAALDSAVARVSAIKVMRLHYADAKQVAAVVQQMFGSAGSSQAGGAQNGGGPDLGGPGGGFGPPDGPGGPGAVNTAEASAGSAARGSATATADEQANALIVSAPESVMPAISRMVAQLDRPASETTEMRVFTLRNADPTELADQLAELFPDPTQSGNGQDQGASRFGGMPGPPEMQAAEASANSSTEAGLKKARVLAVPDPRTSSILVTAPATRMPLIARLVANLDAIAARKEVVKAWDLRNAGPQDVNQALQDLFNRTTAARNSNNRSSLLGDSNPLTARATRTQSTTSSSLSGRSSSGGTGGAGAGGGQ